MPQLNSSQLATARRKASKLGVSVKLSTRKNKKLDVFKGDKKVASIGDNRYTDFIQSKDKVIINIGSGVAIEKDQSSATNWLESRLKELEIALRIFKRQLKEVGKLQQLRDNRYFEKKSAKKREKKNMQALRYRYQEEKEKNY